MGVRRAAEGYLLGREIVIGAYKLLTTRADFEEKYSLGAWLRRFSQTFYLLLALSEETDGSGSVKR